MTSNSGNDVPNQFIINGAVMQLPDDTYKGQMFQSYKSNIAFKAYECNNTGNTYKVYLDSKYWNYSRTTGNYRNQFLGETKKETQAKIDNGQYTLTDLNGE